MRRTILLIAAILAVSAIQLQSVELADPQQCIEEKCPNQWASCQKDPKCIPALQDCQKKCGTKASCWSLCLPSKGSQAAIDVAKCAQANNCLANIILTTAMVLATPQECIETHCKSQITACQKDPKCFAALQDCEKECLNNTSCYTTCIAKKGNSNASNFWKCIVDNDCLNQVSTALEPFGADPQQCIEEKCPNQWAACQKDAKCIPALQDCQKKCGTSTSCWTFCLPSKGSQAAIDVAKCADKNKCLGQVQEKSVALLSADPQQCIEEKCPNQWAACQKDPKCVPALQDCEKQCGSKVSCWTLCLPGKGSQAAIDVAKCAQNNNCMPAIIMSTAIANPQECILKYCKTQEQACANDRRCRQVLDQCDAQCNTNLTCWNACLARRGNKNASEYFKCIIDNDCLNKVSTALKPFGADPQQCIEEKCPNQWAACQKDPKCVPALQDCEKKCGSKVSCWTLCLPGKGSQAAIDVAKCAQNNNCLPGFLPSTNVAVALKPLADPTQCAQEKCPNQWANCQKDSKCMPALQDCEKKCGTKSSCWTLCLPTKGSQAAIDLAKCAQANGCLGMVPAFESCMTKSCFTEQGECLSNWSCRQSLLKCRVPSQDYDFHLECLHEESKKGGFIADWYHCAGGSFCL